MGTKLKLLISSVLLACFGICMYYSYQDVKRQEIKDHKYLIEISSMEQQGMRSTYMQWKYDQQRITWNVQLRGCDDKKGYTPTEAWKHFDERRDCRKRLLKQVPKAPENFVVQNDAGLDSAWARRDQLSDFMTYGKDHEKYGDNLK